MNEQILTTVEAALQRARVLRPGATLLVALSGGADSVALLRAVCALGAKHGFVTRAAHVEHGLRGAASREDALFCERLCAGLSVPFTLDHARLQGGMCAPGAENRAREARYALLIARAKACRADGLLLAHHLDDQAETVLARLIRGSGARGLSGMRECTVWQGVTLLRPLLSLSRESLLASLEGQPYRTDETNRMPCCQRNRLRAGVLPLLAEENPQAASHIAQSAALLAMDDACLQAQTDALFHAALTDRPPILCVRREPLAQAPPAIAVRTLRRFAEYAAAQLALNLPEAPAPQAEESQSPGSEDGFWAAPWEERSLSAADSLALLELLRAPEGATLNLPHGLLAQASKRFVHLVRMADGSPVVPTAPPPPVSLTGQRGSISFGNQPFRLSAYNPDTDPTPDGILAVVVPNDVLARAVLRVPSAGDRIRPFGAAGGKAFRRYLTDRKLDPPFRPGIPVLCDGAEVLWAVGIGCSEWTRVTQTPSTRVEVQNEPIWTVKTAR